MAGSLEDYCKTDRQLQLVKLRKQGMTWHDIAATLKVTDHRNLRRQLRMVEARAALAGVAPDYDMTHAVPEGFTVKGVSTYYNEDGVPTGQWVKSQSDRELQAQILLEAVEESATLLKRFKPRCQAKAGR